MLTHLENTHFSFSINVLLPVEVAHLGHCRGYCVFRLKKKVYDTILIIQFWKIEYNVVNLFGSRTKNMNKSSVIKNQTKKILAWRKLVHLSTKII